jgi:hypothetical protein
MSNPRSAVFCRAARPRWCVRIRGGQPDADGRAGLAADRPSAAATAGSTTDASPRSNPPPTNRVRPPRMAARHVNHRPSENVFTQAQPHLTGHDGWRITCLQPTPAEPAGRWTPSKFATANAPAPTTAAAPSSNSPPSPAAKLDSTPSTKFCISFAVKPAAYSAPAHDHRVHSSCRHTPGGATTARSRAMRRGPRLRTPGCAAGPSHRGQTPRRWPRQLPRAGRRGWLRLRCRV